MKKKSNITTEAIRAAPYGFTYKEHAEISGEEDTNRYNIHKKSKENQKNV